MTNRNRGRETWGGADDARSYGYGGYGRIGAAPEARGPHYGKGPKGYRRSDERIHEDVCDTIADHGRVDASDVAVKVDGGVVTLEGTVLRREDKRELEVLAEHVHGVVEVRNELRLRRRPQSH